jgi:ribosomal protein S18 acetylase RimI-like enzyme
MRGGFARVLFRPGPDDVTLAAADRWGLVGYAQGGPSRRGAKGEAEVLTLYLVRSAQNRGLGGRLLADAARALAARGASSLVISVLRDNFGARGFYEHLGGEADRRGWSPALAAACSTRSPTAGRISAR